MSNLLKDNEKLMKEYNYEKNCNINLDTLTLDSSKKIWWKCINNHEFESSIHNRNTGTGCPYCSNRKVLKGYNDLVTTYPELVKEWNYEKNNIKPDEMVYGSSKKVWWKCEKGHEWEATISKRNNSGTGCPYCSNHKVLKGYNDLTSRYLELAKEWNYEKNVGLKPDMVSPNSHKKVWWKCEKGHEFESSIDNRSKGTGCPYCSNRKVLKGFNDLETIYPELAKEWNYEKNNINPDQIVYGSNKKIWWKCNECNYEWSSILVSRTKLGNGCPNCRGKKVSITHNATSIKKYGSLEDTHPELAKEWNYEKNGDIKPNNVHKWSSKKVWWKCSKCNNEWKTVIYNRTISGSGCPKCNGETQTSFPEQALYYYLSLIYSKKMVFNRYLYNNKCEIDIFIKEYNIGIEYDGLYYHNGKKNIEKENKKNNYLINHGIKLIRIKENNSDIFYDDLNVDVIGINKNPKFKDYDEMIVKVINRLNKIINKNFSLNISTENDRLTIMNNYIKMFKQKSLLSVNPKLAKEWNYKKNEGLKPDMVSPNSGKKVWWKCEKGHEWEYNIVDRSNGDGCPYCSNRKVLKGFNDLETIYPELVKEWNYEKNNINPDEIVYGSSKKVWWKCVKGHSWFVSINSRSKGTGCPYCSNRKVLKGFNDLETIYPELAKEWNYEKNNINPDEIVYGSRKKVWWKCSKCDKSWETTIYSRKSGNGCPNCSKEKRLNSFYLNKINKLGSLTDNNPELAKEWNYQMNGILTPNKVLASSNKKVWWKCSNCGNEWEATISKRNAGNGCPYCSNHKVLKGYNDFASRYPELAKEWNYKKNNINPDEVAYGSYKKVWWKCSKCGNEWETFVAARTINKTGCPKHCQKKG